MSFVVYLGVWSMDCGVFADEGIPIGPNYKGPKCTITVGDFTVQIKDAPQEIGDGLREMLQTALFESNYFIVMDRLDPLGISAEKLLSESFLADADALLNQAKMRPAEVVVYGAVTSLAGEGWALVCKVPGTPIQLGGGYHQVEVMIDLRAVDSATGGVVAAQSVKGDTLSGKGSISATVGGASLPAGLKVCANTPLELAIRDCIYRAVISLCRTIPQTFFRHFGP